jgi:MFS family permease
MTNDLGTERASVSRPGPRPAGLPGRLAAGPPLPPDGRRWTAFTLLVAAYFITVVDFTIVNVALPTIGRELRFPESDLQWLVTAYGLTFAGFLLLGGRAADLLGRRRVLMAGLAVFTVASLAGGLATSDAFLIVMRGLQGLGAALVLPAALSIVTTCSPKAPSATRPSASGAGSARWAGRSACWPAGSSPPTPAGGTSSSSTSPSARRRSS